METNNIFLLKEFIENKNLKRQLDGRKDFLYLRGKWLILTLHKSLF
jgi:hypothetical protein